MFPSFHKPPLPPRYVPLPSSSPPPLCNKYIHASYPAVCVCVCVYRPQNATICTLLQNTVISTSPLPHPRHCVVVSTLPALFTACNKSPNGETVRPLYHYTFLRSSSLLTPQAPPPPPQPRVTSTYSFPQRYSFPLLLSTPSFTLVYFHDNLQSLYLPSLLLDNSFSPTYVSPPTSFSIHTSLSSFSTPLHTPHQPFSLPSSHSSPSPFPVPLPTPSRCLPATAVLCSVRKEWCGRRRRVH